MTTAYTSLLGLALPVTGELSGTWGQIVNDSITSLVDTSVAGTTNVSADSNVTLTTTTGASNQARQAILLFSGARTAIRTVTAPAQSKIYTVINATTGGFAVTLVGAGPTTGVTIANGARTVVAWNGSDFVEVSSPSSIILPGGTANGVLYLNGSKVVTSGSGLTYNGTTLTSTVSPNTAALVWTDATNGTARLETGTGASRIWSNVALAFGTNAESFTERMRLNDTGLGIGTSSPANPLHIVSNTVSQLNVAALSGNTNAQINLEPTGTGIALIGPANNVAFAFRTNATERMRIDASGNLGLGNTPNSWGGGYVAFQVSSSKHNLAATTAGSGNLALSFNAFFDTTDNRWEYIYTGDPATQYSTSSGQHRWFNAPSGTAGNAITFTQAMTLDASGNLGIGTTSPQARLGINATNQVVDSFGIASFNTTDSQAANLGGQITLGGVVSGTTQTVFGAIAGRKESSTSAEYKGYLQFSVINGTSVVERARIDSSGVLLVNRTSYISGVGSSCKLQVLGGQGEWSLGVSNDGSTQPYGILMTYGTAVNTSNWPFFLGSDTSATRFSVYSNGGIANYQANDVNLSDCREKTNFAPAGSYLDKICAIPVQTFNYIDQNMEDDGGLTLGVVAQDVQAVAPELVMESNWAKQGDAPKMRLSIYQTDLQYALMKCIQEQQAIIESLKARLDAANL
jgi:hypothetical protein